MDVAGAGALVSGGASGLGGATASALAEAGARVVILDLPQSRGAEHAASLPNSARFVAADVTDEAAVQRAVDAAAEDVELRVLVNCAGLGPPAKVVGRDGAPMPMEHFTRIVSVNLFGTFNCTRLGAARMVRNAPDDDGERGVVVNTASIAAFDGQIRSSASTVRCGCRRGSRRRRARPLLGLMRR